MITGEIFVPVLLPFPIEEEWQILTSQVFAEILSLKTISLPYSKTQAILGVVDDLPPNQRYLKYLLNAQKSSIRKYKCFRITSTVPNEPMPYFNMDGSTAGHGLWVNKAMLEEALAKRASDLVIAANLSYPGSIGIGCPVIFIDRKYHKTKDSMHADGIQIAVTEATRHKWPAIINIPLSTTINWLSSPNWLLDQYGGSPLLRALNVFGYLFASEPALSALGILYSLMGIEALYAKGQEESIGEQIVSKTQVVLGYREGLKKRIKRMYDFRSKLVHGGLDFVPCFTNWYPSELEKRQKQQWESDALSIGILIATFQRMITEGWTTLTFDYRLREAQ